MIQRMKFPFKDLFNQESGEYPQFYANLFTFTKEILDGKLYFLCIDLCT